MSVVLVPTVHAQSFASLRDYEPVVLTGKSFPEWVNSVDISQLALYTFDADGTARKFPFQIDKRRRIFLRYNYEGSNFPTGRGDTCEMGYFRERYPQTLPDTFASNTFQPYDEIVFLLKDILPSGYGARVPATSGYYKSGENDVRYEISLRDTQTGSIRYAYVYRWPSGPPSGEIATTNYMTYATCGAGQPRCATVESLSGVGLPTYQATFTDNWIHETFVVKNPSNTPYSTPAPYDTLLYRVQYDGPNGEDEISWSSGNNHSFLGPLGIGPSGTQQRIRFIRGVEGADSGIFTTKYEFFYPTLLQTRYNYRVHPANPLFGIRYKHERTIVISDSKDTSKQGYVWTQKEYDSSLSPWDFINGAGCDKCPIRPDPEIDEWATTASERRGSYAQFPRELRHIPSVDRSFTYYDNQSDASMAGQGSPGMFGRRYENLGNAEDGSDGTTTWNDGGCDPGSDPESSEYNFGRLESYMFPYQPPNDATIPSSIFASQFWRNIAQDPVFVATHKQLKDTGDYDLTPCTDEVVASDTGAGLTHISRTSYCSIIDPMRLFRGEGTSGSFVFLADMGTATSFDDYRVMPGKTYRYKTQAYNEWNRVGSWSGVSTATITDTTRPGAPSVVIGVAGPHSATVKWGYGTDRDVNGYNLYKATSSAGPFTLVNGSPIRSTGNLQYVVYSLTPGQNYYFRVSALDVVYNESLQSGSVLVVPTD
jgi:hypothetical protein